MKVVCRVRPQNARERKEDGPDAKLCVKCTSLERIDIDHVDTGTASFAFDRVFGPESTQVQVNLGGKKEDYLTPVYIGDSS